MINPFKCPKCSSTAKYRIKRKGLSRYMPGAKDYVCDNCSKRYTVVKLLFFLEIFYIIYEEMYVGIKNSLLLI